MNLQPKRSVFGCKNTQQSCRFREIQRKAQKFKKHLTNLQEKASCTHLRKLLGHISESLLHTKTESFLHSLYIYILGNKKFWRPNTHTLSLHFCFSLVLPSLEPPRKKKKLQSYSKPRVFSPSKSSP